MIGLQDLPFDFSGIGIKALSRVWMLQRKYLWQLFMPSNINGVLGYLVSQYCQDVSLGPYGLGDVVKMQHGAFLRFYAGLQSIKTVNLSFMLPVDNTVLDYFYGWYHLMINEQGYYHPKNNYSKQIYVSLYDRSGIEAVKFIMKGTFPTSKPSVGLSYNANDVQRVDIPLSVDNVEMWSLTGSIRSGISGLIGGVVGGVAGTVAANAVMGVGGGAASRGLGKIL